MPTVLTPRRVASAVSKLAKCPVLGPLVAQHPRPKYQIADDVFSSLTGAIVSQQLSTKAADTIYNRFLVLMKKKKPDPRAVQKLSVEQMREVGLSWSKAGYILDLAKKTVNGELHISRFTDMPEEDVIAEITSVRGLGEWSAHMFLMFALNRPDVWPTGDLGIKNGVARLVGRDEHLSFDEMMQVAEPWRPYRTVAASYIWMSLDNKPM